MEGKHTEKRLKVIYIALFWVMGYSEGSQEHGKIKGKKK